MHRRTFLRCATIGGLSIAAGRVARAQMQPGPPTPGVVQATIAEPAPAPDVASLISPIARSNSLMVVNKLGLTVGFYDPATGAPQKLFALPSRPHELLIARDGKRAYVSIYGDGIYGQNPHPGNQIAIIDLERREPVGFLSTIDIWAPHGLTEGPDGIIWASCDIGAAVVGFDPVTRQRVSVIETGTKGGHWIVSGPDGLAFLSNRAGAGIPMVDLVGRRHVGTLETPHAITGLDLSPDGQRLFAADDQEPALLTIDVRARRIRSTTVLAGLPRPVAIGGDRERRVKVTPDGRNVFLSDFPSAALVRVDVDDPARQRLLLVQHGPMSMAFSPDSRTAWICDHDAGAVTIVDIVSMEALVDFKVGEGCETVALLA